MRCVQYYHALVFDLVSLLVRYGQKHASGRREKATVTVMAIVLIIAAISDRP